MVIPASKAENQSDQRSIGAYRSERKGTAGNAFTHTLRELFLGSSHHTSAFSEAAFVPFPSFRNSASPQQHQTPPPGHSLLNPNPWSGRGRGDAEIHLIFRPNGGAASPLDLAAISHPKKRRNEKSKRGGKP